MLLEMWERERREGGREGGEEGRERGEGGREKRRSEREGGKMNEAATTARTL